MIVWLNGTFGAGKTTTAAKLVGLLPSARFFDPEQVGFMLRHVLREPVHDFQDLPPWRGLVRETARQVLAHTGGTLVAPQTILAEDYAREIFDGLAADSVPVHHFVLHTNEDELVHRIEHDTADPGARQWRLDHVKAYFAAVPWLHASGTVVDTTGRTPDEVAHAIVSHLA
ncbi:MAG: AAA family ATPase [Actinophytocola sp.]|uniref:AAA family ATPase n=1 Tax=Actinophytocola sp. TaxID=1872138 RepID=UPI003C751B98